MSSSKNSLASWRIGAWVSWALLLFALGARLVSGKMSKGKLKVEETTVDHLSPGLCPPCDLLFSKLQWNTNGTQVQDVSVLLRGEPKSGTTYSMEWASESLYFACNYLDALYGNGSCQMSRYYTSVIGNVKLIFDPSLGDPEKAICQCEEVERVKIKVEAHLKHLLPVSEACPWWRGDGMATPSPACTFVNGTLPSNYEEVLSCIEEAGCEFTGSELQMAIFRDPRPMAVSSYFRSKSSVHKLFGTKTIDEFVQLMFPFYCQWVSIRFFVFEGFLSYRSSSFWFHEWKESPLVWHKRFLDLVGLQLPGSVVKAACIATTEGEMRTKTRGRNEHPGGQPVLKNRSYVDEISTRTQEFFNEEVVRWMPPTFRKKAMALR